MCAPFNRAFIRAKPVSQKNWYKYPYLGDSDIYKPHIVAHGITLGVIFTQNFRRKYRQDVALSSGLITPY